MLDQDFCELLEYKVCEALKSIDDDKAKDLWCDGVLLLEDEEHLQKTIQNKRQATLKAYVGKDGQDEYILTLHFGRKALSRYTKQLNINECIPQTDFKKWFNIDTLQHTIEIQLD